jgi:methionyl-tRNA formyltransferase
MNIICCGYRDWAKKIFLSLPQKHNYLFIKDNNELIYDFCVSFKPDFFLFYGWSWIVDKKILDIAPCICLHPSPLPKYRGGSPIQNQIINGETESMVTLFYMSNKLDAGDILIQEKFSLSGHLDEIFCRITDIGIRLTKKILDGNFFITPQDNSKRTIFKRRTPEQSEITIEDFRNKTSDELYDFIRMIEDPYPNAFFICKDKRKLFFKRVEL